MASDAVDQLAEALEPDEPRDLARLVAGLLLTAGFLVFAFRREADGASDALVFALLALPATLLYGLGLAGAYLNAEPRPWQSVFAVAGVLIVPLALFKLADAVASGADGTVVTMLVFAAGAAAAIAAWRVAEIRFQLLLGSVYLLIAGSALLDKGVGAEGLGGHLDTYRLALIGFAVLVAFASAGAREEAIEEPERAQAELLTGAGIALLVAFSLPLIAVASFSAAPIDIGAGFGFGLPEPGLGWDLLALASGIALVAAGNLAGSRGPAYTGGLILLVFILSAALDLDDPTPEPSFVGWPLLLIAAGVALLALSARALPDLGPRRGSGR